MNGKGQHNRGVLSFRRSHRHDDLPRQARDKHGRKLEREQEEEEEEEEEQKEPFFPDL